MYKPNFIYTWPLELIDHWFLSVLDKQTTLRKSPEYSGLNEMKEFSLPRICFQSEVSS